MMSTFGMLINKTQCLFIYISFDYQFQIDSTTNLVTLQDRHRCQRLYQFIQVGFACFFLPYISIDPSFTSIHSVLYSSSLFPN